MTKIHKVIFPFGSIIGFMSLDDLLSINFLSVDAALSHLYISGIHEKPRSLQALPFLFSTRMSSRFSSFTLKKRPEPATQAMIEDTERTGNESCSLSSISVRDGLMWWVGVRRTIEGGGGQVYFCDIVNDHFWCPWIMMNWKTVLWIVIEVQSVKPELPKFSIIFVYTYIEHQSKKINC